MLGTAQAAASANLERELRALARSQVLGTAQAAASANLERELRALA